MAPPGRFFDALGRLLDAAGLILDALDAFWDAFWLPFSSDLSLFLRTFCIHFKSLIFASTLNCYFMDFDAIDTLKITFLLQFSMFFQVLAHSKPCLFSLDISWILARFWIHSGTHFQDLFKNSVCILV